jgi:hypothetical protein
MSKLPIYIRRNLGLCAKRFAVWLAFRRLGAARTNWMFNRS